MNRFFSFSYFLVIILLCGLVFFPFLGEINLFDWDETLVASISKEMYNHSEVLHPMLNGHYYLYKPPLFFWIQMISFKYLGVNEYAARIPNALLSILVCVTLFKNGSRLYSRYFGMSWVIVYLSIVIVQIYHKSSLIEPIFAFFVYLCLYNMSRVMEMRQERFENLYRQREVNTHVRYSALALVGAFMSYGIEALFVVFFSYLMVFFLSSAKYGLGYKNFIMMMFYSTLIVLMWAFTEYQWHGVDYLDRFVSLQWAELDIQRASWGSKNTFPLLILVIGCFPASIFAFNSLKIKTYEYTLQKVMRLMMTSCLIVTIILTTFFKVKVVHYLLVGIIPISFMATYSLRYILEEKNKIHGITIFLTFIVGLIWAIVLIGVPLTGSNVDLLNKYLNGESIVTALRNIYEWKSYEVYFGGIFLFFLILSTILMVLRYNKIGAIMIFFTTLVISNAVVVYFMPKIETISQGPQIEFVKQNIDQSKSIKYLSGRSYATNFYKDNNSSNFDNQYIIVKNSDTSLMTDSSGYHKMFSQGLYSFYEKK